MTFRLENVQTNEYFPHVDIVWTPPPPWKILATPMFFFQFLCSQRFATTKIAKLCMFNIYFYDRSLTLAIFFIPNTIHEKISPFWLVKSSAVLFLHSAKRGNKPSILIGQWSKKLKDGQSNQAHALDGANWWRNFSLICVIAYVFSAWPSRNFFMYILISIHMIFHVQFGINKHM